MDVEEVLEFADHLVFGMTGKHLDSLQKAILRGAWDNQKYREIAEHHNRSETYVKEVGFKLWKLLSDILGEELTKANFRAALERRWRFSHLLPFWKAFVVTDYVFADTSHSLEVKHLQHLDEDMFVGCEEKKTLFPSSPFIAMQRQYLSDAPDVFPFWGRTEELTKLEKWIVEERCRLVLLFGMSGIGKSALAVKLVEQIKDKFEFVIWRSLSCKPPLEAIERNIIKFLSNQQESEVSGNADARLSQLMEYLRKYRCLVILDDVHLIFSSGQLASFYEDGYEDYSLLFKRLGELTHESCFLLTSWDKPREIATLEGETRPVRSLQLDGLDVASAGEILREKGLAKEEKWDYLINHYGGNPLWLKILGTMIDDLFDGCVSEFLQYNKQLSNEDLKQILHQQFNRLSEVEKDVISRLANEAEPVTLSKLLEHIELPPSELFNAIQSLRRRSLIEKKEGNGTVFTLQPVLKQYVKNKSDRISEAIYTPDILSNTPGGK